MGRVLKCWMCNGSGIFHQPTKEETETKIKVKTILIKCPYCKGKGKMETDN